MKGLMQFTKAIFLTALLLAVSVLVLRAAQVRETLEKSIAFISGGDVSIATVNGDIDVRSWAKNEIFVSADVRVRAGDDQTAEDIFKAIELKVVRNGSGVEIYIEKPPLDEFGSGGIFSWLFNGGRPSISAAFVVHLPFQSSVRARSTNGSIRSDSLYGDVDFRTTNGKVETGAVVGMAQLKSTNGKIDARQVAGGVLAQTTNGGIDIVFDGEGAVDQKIECITTNGGIYIKVPKLLASDIDGRTTNGGITVELSEVTGANVFLTTSNGVIRTEFPLTIEGEISKHKLIGTIGDGGREIRLKTTNGSIQLGKIN